MKASIQSDINFLTATIEGAQGKPYLRSTIAYQLVQLDHAPADIDKALDTFYSETRH